MDEIAIPVTEAPKPVKRAPKRKKAAKPKRAVIAPAKDPAPKHEFAGMTARTCPAACTAERCVISTVNICKHPKLTADSGCGQVTLRNRERARKYLKHQEIERE